MLPQNAIPRNCAVWLGRHVVTSADDLSHFVGAPVPTPASTPALPDATAATQGDDEEGPEKTAEASVPALSAAAALRLRVELSALLRYRPTCERHHADMHYSAAARPLVAPAAPALTDMAATVTGTGTPVSAKKQSKRHGHNHGAAGPPAVGDAHHWIELTNRRLQVRIRAWDTFDAFAVSFRVPEFTASSACVPLPSLVCMPLACTPGLTIPLHRLATSPRVSLLSPHGMPCSAWSSWRGATTTPRRTSGPRRCTRPAAAATAHAPR